MSKEFKEEMLPLMLENYKSSTLQSMKEIFKVNISLAAMQFMLVIK